MRSRPGSKEASPPAGFSRRRFLSVAAAAAGAVGFPVGAAGQEARPESSKALGPPPSELGQRSPFVSLKRDPHYAFWSYTPLGDLEGVITPSDLHYEVHHGGMPAIDPKTWTLTIHGMVERPLVLTLEDLKRFSSVSRLHFLECSANSPFSWDPGKPEDTAQTRVGLTSNSEWVGVPVATLLSEVGVQAAAKWAVAEGQDAVMMTRSVPIEKLRDDALVAYGQNGEPLRPAQGYPARLLVPGWEGNVNVKWLRRLELTDQPVMHKEETGHYTDPMPDGTVRQFTFVMECRSVITRPSGGQVLSGHGYYEIRGVAWSGRGRIRRVEVSTDGGRTWREATLDGPVVPKAHTRFRLPWVWEGSGAVLQSRATDETGYIQPTREQLVKVRGTASIYHYNGIQSWNVARDGRVTNVNA
jgi:sulfane dehydrogenase subunit SoxC